MSPEPREFAKQVFVPWNQATSLPFAHSADPYVSNPYRIPRFDKSVRAKRKKPAEFDAALAVLEMLEAANSIESAYDNLVEVMFALRRFIADRSIAYPIPNRVSLQDAQFCITEFASERSGGARLQAVVYALFRTLESRGFAYRDIKSGHVNSADMRSKSPGDVSFALSDSRFAIEIKDRSLNRAELDATIDKCRFAKVGELLFIIRASKPFADDLSADQFRVESNRQFSSGLNIYVEQFSAFAQAVLVLVGEQGRRVFLEAVGDALGEQNADIKHKWAWADMVKNI